MDQTPQQPLVSIQCLVYNHEPYLRQCLDGFVMQQTDFKFEAIVHDDASTDRSADIIREYAEKYPDIIKPILQKVNQYSKGRGTVTRIINSACNGKYIAVCEGDDYWIDPLKLQKQVDFMEAHPDYSMCFSDAEVLFEGAASRQTLEHFYKLETREYTGIEILNNWTVPTASVLYRNPYFGGEFQPMDTRFIYGDIALFLWVASKGKVWCIDEKMVTYRRNERSVSLIKVPIEKKIDHYTALNEHFGSMYNKVIRKLKMKTYYGYLRSPKYDSKEIVRYVWRKDILYFIPFLIYACYRYFRG